MHVLDIVTPFEVFNIQFPCVLVTICICSRLIRSKLPTLLQVYSSDMLATGIWIPLIVFCILVLCHMRWRHISFTFLVWEKISHSEQVWHNWFIFYVGIRSWTSIGMHPIHGQSLAYLMMVKVLVEAVHSR